MAKQKENRTSKPGAGAEAEGRKLHTGGNPSFDERRAPEGKPLRRGKAAAGGNPWFDESSRNPQFPQD